MIYFVSEKTIKENSNIDVNTDTHYILPALREAQEIELQTIIGQMLYQRLQGMIEDKSIDEEANALYRAFLGEIKYYLIYNVLSNIILKVNYKINNGGLQQTSDENLQPVQLKDAQSLKQYYEDRANFYGERIRWFMVDHYDELGIGDEDVTNLRAQLDDLAPCSIYLGGAKNPSKRFVQRYRTYGYDMPWKGRR